MESRAHMAHKAQKMLVKRLVKCLPSPSLNYWFIKSSTHKGWVVASSLYFFLRVPHSSSSRWKCLCEEFSSKECWFRGSQSHISNTNFLFLVWMPFSYKCYYIKFCFQMVLHPCICALLQIFTWYNLCLQFSSVQSLSRVLLFTIPWTTACQASRSITNSWSPPKPMSIELVMPSNHLILCCHLLLLPSIFPSIRANYKSFHGFYFELSQTELTLNSCLMHFL